MKKIASVFVLAIFLTFSVAANDGTTHTNGKTCPPGQTSCLIEPQETKPEVSLFQKLFEFFGRVFE